MVKSPELSVILPVYGQFDLARADMSVQSILSQKDIDYEVIVSEQGEAPRFPKIKGIKHIFKYHKPKPDLSDFNPGNVRNEAVAQAISEFVYTNDADIVLLQRDYLARCVEEMKEYPNRVFYRPFMRRLPIDEFSQFERLVQERGIVKAIQSLNLEQKYIATLNGRVRKIRVFEKDSVYHKTFTAFEEDFQTYVSDERNKGREPIFWNENRHCGGNLFHIEQFKAVGRYSEEFVNWGCEDSDLQWKFSQLYDLKFFPENLEVLHLDHSKGYFSPEMWARNEEISRKRVEEGLESVIERDKRNLQ
jgi:glycosyltransferase involved in cell wall biosynthesis